VAGHGQDGAPDEHRPDAGAVHHRPDPQRRHRGHRRHHRARLPDRADRGVEVAADLDHDRSQHHDARLRGERGEHERDQQADVTAALGHAGEDRSGARGAR
jgi:hypothetical protein